MSEESNIKRRRVARACDTCRRKKVRCDGVQAGSDPPSCTNCKAYGYECSFIDAPKKRGPPKGYIEALETRLQRMESILGGLVQSGDLPEGAIPSNLEWINVDETSFTNNSNQDSGRGGGQTLRKSASYDAVNSRTNSLSRASSLASTHRTDGYSRHHKSHDSTGYRYHSSDSEGSSGDSKDESNYDLNDSMGQLAIDESGQTRYLGNSSGIFVLKITKKVANGQIISVSNCGFNSQKERKSSEFMLPPRELCDRMVDVFFTQFHPCSFLLDQQEFREKYANLENNTSILLLLYAIFAVTSRFMDLPELRSNPDDPSTNGEQFFERAKELLKEEFDEPHLSTLQALLLMGFYQQGGRNSKTWIYTGLAIRIAQDMGLHRDSSKWSLDPRQIEIRKRVWWVCYMSDRFTSAGLGRPMTINESDCDVPYPVVGPDEDSQAIEDWVRALKLAQILGRVLQHIYGIKSKHTTYAATDSVLTALDAELNAWRESLPPEFLQHDTSNGVGSQIISKRTLTHLMFYTIQILLHRPHIRGPNSKAPPSAIPSLTICTVAANNITHLMYRTMKDGTMKRVWNCTLYFFFTATVMHVINALSGDDRFREVAKHGLRMSLKCLDYLKPYWFGSERCILVIRDLLRARNINIDGVNSNGNEPQDKSGGNDQLKVESACFCDKDEVPLQADGKNSHVNGQHRVTFAPSSSTANLSPTSAAAATTTGEYSAQMAAAAAAAIASQNGITEPVSHHQRSPPTASQQQSPLVSYEQSPSPASSNSSNNFTSFGSEFLSQDNAFFPPNADAFAADVSSSLMFDEDDPLGSGNPFWSIPSNISWSDWAEYMNGMQGLRATATAATTAAVTAGIGILSGLGDTVTDNNIPSGGGGARLPMGL